MEARPSLHHPRRGAFTADLCLPSPSALRTAVIAARLLRLGFCWPCLCVIACTHLLGCKGSPSASQPEGYFGVTETLIDVVGAINNNNGQLPTLWAKGDFEATFSDRGRSQFVNGSATILVRKPSEFRLVGKKDIAGQIFELGTTRDEYWMIVRPEADTMWWGSFEKLATADSALIPIQPDLLSEVLAVGDLNTDLTREPAPVMRFNNDADAYMFVWIVRAQSKWVAQKEVWYDRETKHPRLVLLFDVDGRIVLRAYLSKHQQVGETNAFVATEYDLLFPDRQAKLKLSLNELKLENNGVPREGSIRFPGPNADNAGVSNVVRIDDQSPAR